jgi:hypothetical protein
MIDFDSILNVKFRAADRKTASPDPPAVPHKKRDSVQRWILSPESDHVTVMLRSEKANTSAPNGMPANRASGPACGAQ